MQWEIKAFDSRTTILGFNIFKKNKRGTCLWVGMAIEKNRRSRKCQVEKQYQRDNQSMAAMNNSYSQSSISCKINDSFMVNKSIKLN